ncbi:MAG TPA: V-type ATP synthase subunit E [Tissierellaceae bacterium]|nr:V-type ATP synthase subunit E [Tissierellaceae bacterium]
MSNLENIIDKILADGKREAQEINDESQKNNQEIIDSMIKNANEEKDRILDKAKRESLMLKERKISEAELKVRDEKLKAKRQILDKVFVLAKERLVKMDENTYITFLKQSLANIDLKGSEVLLVPEKFIEVVEKSGIYSNVSRNEFIESGFQLKDGNIMINHSFESLVDFGREDLEVEIARELLQE